jgi:hypothetical protein
MVTAATTTKYLPVLLFVLLAPFARAQSNLPDLRVQNSGGTVVNLHEVRLLRVEPDGLRVAHSAGMAKVPYELLPAELRAKYRFNATTAQEHRTNTAAATAAAAAAAAQAQAAATSSAVYTAAAASPAAYTSYRVAATGSFPTPSLSSSSLYSYSLGGSSSRVRSTARSSCGYYGSSYYGGSYYGSGYYGCGNCCSSQSSYYYTSRRFSRPFVPYSAVYNSAGVYITPLYIDGRTRYR